MKATQVARLSWFVRLALLLSIPISLVAQPWLVSSIPSSDLEFIQGLKRGQVPQASTRTVLYLGAFPKCPNRCYSVGDAAQMLSKVLRQTGYTQQAWYLTENRSESAIVVLTELEQIQNNGHPRTNGKRWSMSYSPPELNSFQSVLERVIKGAPPGRYRSFIFSFSHIEAGMTNTGPGWEIQKDVELERLNRTIRAGNRVPVVTSLSSVPANNYACYVFVYEYEKSPADGSIKFIRNSSLTVEQHLKGARIWQELGLN